MMVMRTAGATEGALPKLVVVLAGAEIDALLAGSSQRFPFEADGRTLEVELLAGSATPTGPKPPIRLRIADDALRASRIGTVTPVFPDPIPFTLVLTCSDPPPAGPVRVTPGVVHERIDRRSPDPGPVPAQPSPRRGRLLVAAGLLAFFGVLGWTHERDTAWYWLVGIVTASYALVRKQPRR